MISLAIGVRPILPVFSLFLVAHTFRHHGLHSALQYRVRSSSLFALAEQGEVVDTPLKSLDRRVIILSRASNFIVALKPPAVLCHHSAWARSRSSANPEIPMLQRVRDGIHDIDTRNHAYKGRKRRVNVLHRLDRGASGALLFAFADDLADHNNSNEKVSSPKSASAQLSDALTSDTSTKTYVALVRGSGVFRGENLSDRGWFEESRPIKDERGKENNATTVIKFIAGQPEHVGEDGAERPRMSIVLARPKQGRWHQIRKHLYGLGHPILGDQSHGCRTTNREWKKRRNLPDDRLCLHMARIELASSEAVPEGIDVSCPLLRDMLDMLREHAPKVLEDARPILESEGIGLEMHEEDYEIGEYTLPGSFLIDGAAE